MMARVRIDAVKKAANASPNHALKREREQRCWSQLEVADRIGTTAFNVSRWERGVTFPSSYFRQQLCAVFEKSPQELGLLATMGEDMPEPEQQEDAERATPPPSEMTPPPIKSIWNVPYRRNPFFSGREVMLEDLHERFLHAEQREQAQALCGLGGIGKTQTALEYVYRFRDDYRIVLWVRAETHPLLTADFAAIASLLALPEMERQNQQQVVAAVKHWLCTHDDWLLVYDNADDLEMVSEFLPHTSGGHILLTTRTQHTGTLARPILLEKLSQEEGTRFLLRRARLSGDTMEQTQAWSQASTLAALVDGLPLALDQAAAYIEETGCGLSGYVQRYQQRSMALLSRRGGLRPDHPEPVATTWSLAFEKVERANLAASELLRLCAFLHPDAIFEDMLSEGAQELTPSLQQLASDPFELDAALHTLALYSLLRRDAEQHVLTLHRLVQLALRAQMDTQTQRQWAERAIQLVNQVFSGVSSTTRARCGRYLPHALVCIELMEQLHLATPAALSLLNKVGAYLRECSQYTQAEALLTQAQRMSEAMLLANDPLLAENLDNLGMLYHDRGKYAEAEPLLLRALTIYEQLWGPEHVAVAVCLTHLVENCRVQAQHERAEQLVRRALAIREHILGPDHPDVAFNLNQLAALFQAQDRYSEAEQLYHRVLTIRQQALGSEHIDVAETLNNLAYLYDTLGKYSEAEALYQQVLTYCEQHLGTHHLYTASTMSNLAEVQRAQGHIALAEQLHQRVLTIRLETLGADHPHIGKSLHCLAELALAQEEYILAEGLAKQAIEKWKKALGEKHPFIAVGQETLARVYRAQEQLHKAELLAQQTLAHYQEALGQEHQYVASGLNTLAEIYCDQMRYDEAEAFLQRALHIQRQALGKEHPHLTRSMQNLEKLRAARSQESSIRHLDRRMPTVLQGRLRWSQAIVSPTAVDMTVRAYSMVR